MERENLDSNAYAYAMRTYTGSLDRWEQYRNREAKGLATSRERVDEKRALAAGIKEIDKYLAGRQNRNLDNYPKTKQRVEKIEQAKKNMQTRIRRIELVEKKMRRQELEQRRQQLEARKKEQQFGARAQQALEHNASKASDAATRQLDQLGSRRALSEQDMRNARTAVATLVLEDRLKQPGSEPLRRELAGDGKKYAKAIKDIANSREFREAFPNSTLTPANCRNLANNPKVASRCARDFSSRMVQKAQAKKQRQQQMNRQKEMTKSNDRKR